MLDPGSSETSRGPGTAPSPGLAIGVFLVSVALAWTVGTALQLRHLGWGLLATELGGFALPAVAALVWGAREGRRLLGGKSSLRELVLTGLLGLAVGPCAAGLGCLVRRALGIELPNPSLSIALAVAVLVAAPLGEELLFRPVVQAGLSRSWRAPTALALTACFFGLAHGSAIRFPETFVVGIFSGVVYLKTRSYWLCALHHGAANAGGLIWLWLVGTTSAWLPLWGGLSVIPALILARLLGPPPPLEWGGWRAWVSWPLFGGSRLPPPDRPVGTVFSALCWGCLLAMGGLVLLSSRFEWEQAQRTLVKPTRSAESDLWLWGEEGVIRAESEITFESNRPLPRTLPLILPYPEARIIEVVGPEGMLPWRMVYLDLLEVILAKEDEPAPTRTRLRVRWELPQDVLSRDPVHGWRVRLKAFLPVHAYRLDLLLPPDSSWAFRGDPDARRKTLFSIEETGGRPRSFFGTCGVGLEPCHRGPAAGQSPPAAQYSYNPSSRV